MKSRPIYPYISFGASLRFLQDSKVGYLIHSDGAIFNNIAKVLRKLNQLNLTVSLRSAPTRDLIKFQEKIQGKTENERLTQAEASELNEIIRQIRIVIEAETSGSFAFVVTDKRLDVQKLLSDVKSLMPQGTFNSLTETVRYDLTNAGRCLAFELPTAASFHVLRATEGQLRDYYCNVVKKSRTSPLLWGPMTIGLRARKNPPPETILNLLDHIRNSFRNPTQHPDKIYEMDEAQDLFGLCIDAISRMRI